MDGLSDNYSTTHDQSVGYLVCYTAVYVSTCSRPAASAMMQPMFHKIKWNDKFW